MYDILTIIDTTKYVVGDGVTMEDVYSINTGDLYGAIIGKDGTAISHNQM